MLGDRLDAAGVRDAWSAAEQLAAAGLDAQWVDELVALAGASAEAVVHWIAASLAARGLATDLRTSTARISSLVGAVKDYTYMDQGGEQEVDLHAGLDATLRILGRRLHETGVDVVRDYADDVPTDHGSRLPAQSGLDEPARERDRRRPVCRCRFGDDRHGPQRRLRSRS